MKKLSIFSTLLVAMGMGFTSCSDMLEKDSSDKVYVSAQDTLYSYWGILQKVQGIAERNVIINEIKGDLVTGSSYVSDSINNIANYEQVENGSSALANISDYYAVINNCNLYLESCDTAAIKNNNQYMVEEYAQVLAIRAWTYLQMVYLYGEVSFYTQGIRSLSFLDSYDGKTVNKNTLATELGPQLLQIQAKVGFNYPSYGDYDTGGGVTVSAALCMFHPYLVYADMQLAAGNYDEAAYRYWEWLLENDGALSNSCFPYKYKSKKDDDYTYTATSYVSQFTNATRVGDELITVIPSASNKQFGKMLTGVANLYGYTSNSVQSTEEGSEDDGSDASTSASLSLSLNYKKELDPSQAYLDLNKAQYYVAPTGVVMYQGDVRGTAGSNASLYRSTNTDDNKQYLFIQKFCPYRSFTYNIPLYRRSQVWLRLAEAINRMGFPEYAFAILKDGLCAASLPKIETYQVSVEDEEGNVTTETRERFVAGDAYYIDSLEYMRAKSYPQLDFTNDKWTTSSTYNTSYSYNGQDYKKEIEHMGIHVHGCGDVEGYSDTLYFDYKKILAAAELTPESPLEDRVNAIENVIVDEMALECAFEGTRFSDLVRIADHKNQAGYNGNLWFAAKVAGRNGNNTVDKALLEKLKQQSNWYLPVPAWK
jgi:hypothetical protein